LAWVYFNDHQVEWQYVESKHEDFPLRAVNLKYMRSYAPRFADRFALLAKSKTRADEDPYGLLSIHVHATASTAAPAFGDLSTLVQNVATCDDCVKLQRDIAEYLTDVLAAWYADRWQDFPEQVKVALKSRLPGKALSAFCA
jgi:hypothetical protein